MAWYFLGYFSRISDFVWLPNIIKLNCSIVFDYVQLCSIRERSIVYPGTNRLLLTLHEYMYRCMLYFEI